MRGLSSEDEQIHEPAKEESAQDHEQEEGEAILDLVFSFLPSDKRQNDADKKGIDDQGEKMALQNHFFFPAAIS